MGIFDKGQQAAPPVQSGEIPAPMSYEVLAVSGWVNIDAHNVEVKDGCLNLVRIVWADEHCTAIRFLPGHIFAPGEWRQCKTRYAGHRRSPLAI